MKKGVKILLWTIIPNGEAIQVSSSSKKKEPFKMLKYAVVAILTITKKLCEKWQKDKFFIILRMQPI